MLSVFASVLLQILPPGFTPGGEGYFLPGRTFVCLSKQAAIDVIAAVEQIPGRQASSLGVDELRARGCWVTKRQYVWLMDKSGPVWRVEDQERFSYWMPAYNGKIPHPHFW